MLTILLVSTSPITTLVGTETVKIPLQIVLQSHRTVVEPVQISKERYESVEVSLIDTVQIFLKI